MIYDDASLPYFIFPCTLALAAVIILTLRGRKKEYHKKFIIYRAFAEALRIQFYMSMCLNEDPIITNASDFYIWSQKLEMLWITKALKALAVMGNNNTLNIYCHNENKNNKYCEKNSNSCRMYDCEKCDYIISNCSKYKERCNIVMNVWIGDNDDPTGQLKYHKKKKVTNKEKLDHANRLKSISQVLAILMYCTMFIFEIIAIVLKALDINWFWEENVLWNISYRNLSAIALGTITAGSLLASSYWGKLSLARKLDDNKKMYIFYQTTYNRWNNYVSSIEEIAEFVKGVAREEIIENGIWYSYVNENSLEINI